MVDKRDTSQQNPESLQHGWDKLPLGNVKWGSRPCNLIQISDHEFLTMGGYLIHIFNIVSRLWKTYAVYDEKNNKAPGFINPKIAWDSNNKKLFIQEDFAFRIVQFNTHRDEFIIVHTHIFRIGEARIGDKIICINDKCHSIGSTHLGENYAHQIWDNQSKHWIAIHSFEDFSGGLDDYGLCYNKSKQELILFGGKDLDTIKCNKYIMICNVVNGNWRRHNPSIELKSYEFAHAQSKDGILLIAGGTSGVKIVPSTVDTPLMINGIKYHYKTEKIYQDVIWIAEMEDMNLSQSKMKLPFGGPGESIIMENTMENNLLVHGWIRKEMKESNVTIPFAIISLLIKKWHWREYLYIFLLHDNAWQLWHTLTDNILCA